jgi:hypothetical protein
MTNKMFTVLGVFVAGLGLLAATTQGCGGSGGGTGTAGNNGGTGSVSTAQITALCMMICDKEATCNNLPALAAPCKANCSGGAGGATGTSISGFMTSCPSLTADQAFSKASACVSGTCAALDDCLGNICPGASGAAGTSGGAGTSGSAGTSGGAGTSGSAGTSGGAGTSGSAGVFGGAGTAGSTCATACAKADACCVALEGSSANCQFKMECDAATSANMTQIVQACNQILQGAAAAGAAAPAACK